MEDTNLLDNQIVDLVQINEVMYGVLQAFGFITCMILATIIVINMSKGKNL